jgi:hypothetical protein
MDEGNILTRDVRYLGGVSVRHNWRDQRTDGQMASVQGKPFRVESLQRSGSCFPDCFGDGFFSHERRRG